MHFHATRPELCEVKPLHRNRRECVRYPAEGSAIAIAELGARRIVTTVRLVDASPAGLGLTSPMDLPTGAHVRLHFNGSDLPGRSGTIVRCHRADEGFRIGVFCDASVCVA
ncbi:MAG: PilZ domain-containing protein [Phycisphaerales bacterium JB040]